MTTATRNHREYRTADKSAWGPGPWQDEPDKVQWIDEATGLDCLIVRNRVGSLCGYVGLPESHPLHGKDFMGENAPDVEVHGGLTFSSFCMEHGDESRSICHVPEPGRPDRIWWFGFDCSHAGDYDPRKEADYRDRGLIFEIRSAYRDIGYVRSEVESLAAQLKGLDR